MRSVALSEAKDRLSALVDEVDSTHEQIQITKHGRPVAVIMAADELDSLHETLRILSQPGALEELRQAERDAATGDVVPAADLRAKYGLKPNGRPE